MPAPQPNQFYNALFQDSINVVAEIKKPSSSMGLIRKDLDVPALAKSYETYGANALSLVTDKKFFQGDISFLSEVKKEVALSILRKDFIIDFLQLLELEFKFY